MIIVEDKLVMWRKKRCRARGNHQLFKRCLWNKVTGEGRRANETWNEEIRKLIQSKKEAHMDLIQNKGRILGRNETGNEKVEGKRK